MQNIDLNLDILAECMIKKVIIKGSNALFLLNK